MAQRLLVVPQIGEVVLTKRRGSNNLRLSISQSGQIRVGMPYWIPYESGLAFVKKNRQWIRIQLAKHSPKVLLPGHRIGKTHRIIQLQGPAKNGVVETKVTAAAIQVKTRLDPSLPAVQAKIRLACEKALKQQAEWLLPARVKDISQKTQIAYGDLRIRKLVSRWGSCSSKKDITLSYFLIQLPEELIDYVILHELAHTIYHDHGSKYWAYMADRQPNLRDIKTRLKNYKPRVEPYY